MNSLSVLTFWFETWSAGHGRADSLFDTATGKQNGQIASQLAPAITSTAVIALNAGTLSSTRRPRGMADRCRPPVLPQGKTFLIFPAGNTEVARKFQ